MKKYAKIYALGFFDGVHLGHQALLRQCTAAVTFDRHPQSLFTQQPPELINSIEDREKLLHAFGIDCIRVLPVTVQTMSRNWQDFLEDLLAEGADGFVCGHDFRFGHKGEGNAEKLRCFCQQRALPCVIVPEQILDGIRISSTHIRTLIEQGDMEEAGRFLGHPHILSGTVVSGRHIGRTIGVPTANILIPEGVVVPKFGVYACLCNVDGRKYPTVTNVGTRPTVGGHRVTVESWILDFDGDLYNREITLEFHAFLREERKFDSLEALRAEIQKNAAEVRIFFEKT